MGLVTNRRIRVVARRGDQSVLSKLVSLKTGLPQGSVAGPVLYIHWTYAFLFTSIMKSYICLSFILNVLHSLLKVTFANKRKVCSKKFNDVPKSQTLEDVPDIKCFLHERELSA